jgi:NADH-quinone oxidoreductase subunit E
MVQINDDYYEDLNEDSFKKLLTDLKQSKEIKKGSQIGRQTSHPQREKNA